MRFPHAVIIDPRKVLPSRHSIFIRGLPGCVNADSIKEFFAKQADGGCKIDFFSYSDDNAHLFVAVRFVSHAVARKLINKYDGERIFGHKVEINWFKDIRKARKKVIENKHKYQALLAQPHYDSRRRFSGRFQPLRMTSRWNCNRASYHHYFSPTVRQRVSSSNSSASRSCSIRQRSKDRQKKLNRKLSSSSSSSSESSESTVHSKRSNRPRQKSYTSKSSSSPSPVSVRSNLASKRTTQVSSYNYDERSSEKEILQAALDACPLSQRNSSCSRSVSRHSRQQESLTAKRQTSQTDHSADTREFVPRKRKHQKHKRRKRDRRADRYESRHPSPSSQLDDVDQRKILEQEYSVSNAATELHDEDVHAMLEVEQLCLDTSHLQELALPVTSPKQSLQSHSSSETETEPHPSPDPGFLSTASVVAIEHTKEEHTSAEIAESSVSAPYDQSTVNESEVTVDLDHLEGTVTESVYKVDAGTQYLCTLSETDDFHDSLIQLALLTDTDMDEIFQRKRLIEAAYRLDCKSYTTSVSQLVRLNPDLKDRLLSSLRSLLEERAERSINELREFILKIKR